MIFYFTITVWLIIDLLSKYLALSYLSNKINIFWDNVFLKATKNDWIAFSINIPFLKIITIILIIWIFYYYFKEEQKKHNKYIDFWFWLILAWAIWNWIERIYFWEVIDFIWIKGFSIFNIADAFISIWAIIYLIIILKNNK